LRPLHVFDREHRDDLQSAAFLDALTIVSYCGLVLAPLGGQACGVLCHFDMDHCEVKPCELAFLRAVTPLLLDCVN
jgi:hypothetical protein